MRLGDLLQGVEVTKLYMGAFGRSPVTGDTEIRSIQYDSRRVERDDLFVAIRGQDADGHRFVETALSRGAAAVVVEDDRAVPDALFLHSRAVKVVVQDSRRALAQFAVSAAGHPSRSLLLVGVTGTNGKTTTTYLVQSVLEERGTPTGLIGTIEYRIGDTVRPAPFTTPEAPELNMLLAEMVSTGCSAAVMEVSSHALAQHRTDGLEFSAAVFTNLTQDHLDFHGSMEEYLRAKKLLFDGLDREAVAVVNSDDPRAHDITASTKARVVTYAVDGSADMSARDVRMDVRGCEVAIVHGDGEQRIRSSLTGRFNVANILAACTTAVALRVPWEAIRAGIERMPSVRGRFEQIPSREGWTAVVDYAHTPDALENCLRAVRALLPRGSRVITVFGCGGNRDAGKRPLMGSIASRMSDVTVITSDNPRREEPLDIIRQIRAGVEGDSDVITEPDRRAAIRLALGRARPGDVVLIAGKGHEQYQILGDERTHFDDREEVETYLRNRGE